MHRDGCCGRCTSSLVLYSQTGATWRRHFLRAVAAAAFFVHVAAATSASCRGTSQQNITLQRRLLSRPVAAGVSLCLKDVAASQYVCSRGADNQRSCDSRCVHGHRSHRLLQSSRRCASGNGRSWSHAMPTTEGGGRRSNIPSADCHSRRHSCTERAADPLHAEDPEDV